MGSLNDSTRVNLPAGLRGQFKKVEQRLWEVETTTALCRIAACLILSLLLVFLCDRVWETPAWARVVILLAGLAGALAGGAVWWRHWVWQRRDERALAGLVQLKFRRLGDRLLGIVELADEKNHPANFSPELYEAAIQQVASDAAQYEFTESVSPAPARKWSWLAAGIGAGLVAVCVALPLAGANAFLRWIAPWADVQRHTLVALEGFPKELVVAHGEPFEISGAAIYRSFWKPSRAVASLGTETRLSAPVQSGKIALKIPGQVEKGVLEVRVGDAVANVTIIPNHRPSLQGLTAMIKLPDYLQYSNQVEPVLNGTLRALEGSKIGFAGTVTRPLGSAEMQGATNLAAALNVNGQEFTSAPADLSGLGEINFTWRGLDGLTNAAPWRLTVRREPDEPPVASLPDLPRFWRNVGERRPSCEGGGGR